MAQLHEALQNLGPIDWNDVPQDDLPEYLSECFTAGELICNSVPQPSNGPSKEASAPQDALPNWATSHSDMLPSPVRPSPPHADHESLQSHWGKPMKFNQKANPLNIAIYKVAGHDRHGAWFARRSVHEGLGFNKFKQAMMREFQESMNVAGGPGAGAIRGLAADQRLEQIEVPDTGKLEVFQLSAQFPGPTTPRRFMTMLLSGDDVLSDKSTVETEGKKRTVPRHFMVVSRPIEHPDASDSTGMVRGQYESVELIREIANGKSIGSSSRNEPGDSENKSDDLELNPVEWIMITRSDPGGGIPRFLVDRGTPEAMIQDVHKFLDWACSPKPLTSPNEEDSGKQLDVPGQARDMQSAGATEILADGNRKSSAGLNSANPTETNNASSASTDQQTGILTNLALALESKIDTYAPAPVSQMVHQQLHPVAPMPMDENLSDDASDSSSLSSFMSANEMRRMSTAQEELPSRSGSLGIASNGVSDTSGHKSQLSQSEKEMQKLLLKRDKLNQQMAKKRATAEEKLRQSSEKDESESNKQKEKIEKELKKMEEKHGKEIEKLEQRKQKEARKTEERHRKREDNNKFSVVMRERDEFRSQVDHLTRENTLLRELVADLQAQNTIMTNRLGAIGGTEALEGLPEG